MSKINSNNEIYVSGGRKILQKGKHLGFFALFSKLFTDSSKSVQFSTISMESIDKIEFIYDEKQEEKGKKKLMLFFLVLLLLFAIFPI